VKVTGGVFKRIYVYLGACKEGFKAGCSPVIGLDGCFLKTTHEGQLLAAVGIDGENCMFPVAWAVVDAENRANWTWFIEQLLVDIEMYNSRACTFISDKQKGLVEALNQCCEGAEHRYCARHLYSNFTLKHKGLTLKNLFWVIAKSTTVPEWNAVMNEMKTVNEEAFSREKPIITMLDKIRHQQMTRMAAKREAAQRWDRAYGPKIVGIIEKAKSDARFMRADYAGNKKFEVRNTDGLRWSVDLLTKECACRKWKLTEIPCAHAVSRMLSRIIEIDEFVDEYYKKERYLMAYNPVIQPMSGPELWPELGKHPLKSPVKKKQAGRPKKLRKRSQTEPPTGIKMTQTGMQMTCRRCGEVGHNKRTCTARTQPTDAPQLQKRKRERESCSYLKGKCTIVIVTEAEGKEVQSSFYVASILEAVVDFALETVVKVMGYLLLPLQDLPNLPSLVSTSEDQVSALLISDTLGDPTKERTYSLAEPYLVDRMLTESEKLTTDRQFIRVVL
ncbi:uncharacterized protein LOC111374964, partial [Olea europaea var. sylvestris]|uniref:uncharacterized protein LOC111374964 n=1 Tax=Olea europaea var. sylvestris TaxID=158386 RepID=UPI000C1D6F0C